MMHREELKLEYSRMENRNERAGPKERRSWTRQGISVQVTVLELDLFASALL